MIIFKPLIENIKEYQRGNLSENAVRLNTPHSIDETLKKGCSYYSCSINSFISCNVH